MGDLLGGQQSPGPEFKFGNLNSTLLLAGVGVASAAASERTPGPKQRRGAASTCKQDYTVTV